MIGCNAQEKCERRGAGGSPLAGLPPKRKRTPVGVTHVGASSGAGKTTPGETLPVIPSSVLDRSARACRSLSSSTEQKRMLFVLTTIRNCGTRSWPSTQQQPVNRLVSASQWSDAGNPTAAQEPQRPTTPDGHSWPPFPAHTNPDPRGAGSVDTPRRRPGGSFRH
ncbi:MAG: hypothetical protein QOI59_3149 [Gammaproteobacteria bacterium]|nr:hypothetical protein [Gammaproteobacteria bacterium]